MWPRIIPLLIVSLLAGVSLLVSTPPALAAPSSAPDETWVTDGRVQSMEYVGDKVYLGGSFRQVGPNTGFGVALSATEGNWDASFPKVDGNVFAAVADGNGGWYIGGDFSKVGSSERSRLAHILPDGQVDSWSPSANNTVRALALSPDGSRLYLGGTFTNVNGSVRSRLAAVDTTSGSLNMRWNPRANGTVYALSVNDSRIYVGGMFTTMSGGTVTRNRLAALDDNTGAADPAWNPGANGTVEALELSADGSRLYAGGQFTTVGGAAHNRLAAIDGSTGAVDAAWNPEAEGDVNALALSADGARLFAGGSFTSVNQTSRNRVAAIETSTGTLDAAWNPNANGTVYTMSVSGSKIYVGGLFTTLNGGTVTRNNLAAIDGSTGAVDTVWKPEANDVVYTLSTNGSRIYAGGGFTSVNGVARDRLAAVDAATGTVDPTWNPKANSEVHELALSPDNKRLYVGGGFTRMGGSIHNRLAAVDAATGAVDNQWNPGVDTVVKALAVVGNRVYFGGDFLAVNGQSRQRLAAVDGTTGALDPTWTPRARGGEVLSMVPSKDGTRIYAGGGFTEISGSPYLKLAALDAITGAPDPNWRPDPNYLIWDMSVSSTHLYTAGAGVGGNLGSYDTTQSLSPGQYSWKLMGDGDFQVVLARNGMVYAGGHFDKVGIQERHRLVAVDAATGAIDPAWTPSVFGSNPNDRGVWAMTGTTGGWLYMGGDFEKVAGQVQQGYAQFPDLDATPPTVDLKTPEDGASGVAGDSNVEATFSKEMDPSTLNDSTFTLKVQNSTTALEATVDYDAATKTATLDPLAELEANTTYTATVKGGAEGAKDLAGNALASDVVWSFATSDTLAPETTIVGEPEGLTNDNTPTFTFSSSEADSTFECSLDGALPLESCTSPKTYSGLSDGEHTFEVRAIDNAGNIDPSPDSRTWTVEATAPVVQAPLQSLVMSSTLGTPTIPVRLEWSATDDVSGVSQYQLQQSTNGGAYTNASLSTPTTTGRNFSLSPGGTYQFRVRAMDGAGNWSDWSEGAPFVVNANQESSSAISYIGSWTQQSLSTAYGGTTNHTSTQANSAQFTFSGTNLAWVAPKGPDRGKAEVWIDGVKVSTVDLYASTEQPAKMVFTRSWAVSGEHTIEVRVLGTKTSASSGTRVDVDAFVVLSPDIGGS